MSAHNVYLDIPHSFIVFNDDDALPFDAVLPSDIVPARAPSNSPLASMAWSSDIDWYFVIVEDGIFLFHVDGNGWFCKKRSATFIGMFVEAPKARRRP